MNKWTISQIEILTDYYTNRYAIPEALGDVCDVLERHNEKKYYSYKSLCKIIRKCFENDQKNSFVTWIIRKAFFYLKKLIKIY